MKTASPLSLRQKLAKHSKHDPATDCIHCTLGVTANGYSHVYVRGKMMLSHRASWILENGPLPETHRGERPEVEHVCCSRTCINPLHLRLSTHKENCNHPVTKARRAASKNRRGPSLTDEQRKQIHDLIDAGKTGYEIAKLTGRGETHISSIRRRYEEQKRQAAQTAFIKQINGRLTNLLFPGRKAPKRPSGSDPGASGNGAQSEAASDVLGGSHAA